MKLTIANTKAPDGTYGPFHFLCDLVIKDGVITIEPQMTPGGHYVLAEDGASLTFVHDPAPEPDQALDPLHASEPEEQA